MRLPALIIFLFLQANICLRADDSHCHTPSMIDFVRDTLPKICFDSETAGALTYTMDDVEFYNAHCRAYQDIKQCLQTKLNHCDDIRPGFTRHILSLVESYQLPLEYFDYDAKTYDDSHYLQNLIPFCDGNKLSSYFSQQFDRSLLSCLTNTTIEKHKQCLITFKQNIQVILQTKSSLNDITKWSEDFLRCVYNSIPTSCPTATKEVFIFKELLAVPDKYNSSTSTALNLTKITKQKLPSQIVEEYSQSKRATSSIHGDPHIIQLHTTKAVTCRLLHNRTYISNPYFKITGISKYAGNPELTATAITALQIDFLNSDGRLIAYYRALNGKFPLELNYLDPTSKSIIKMDHSEKRANEASLTLNHIPTATQITVNMWSKFYYFVLRSSELLLNSSDGYLITGCPQNEIIDRQAIVERLRARFAQSQRQVAVLNPRQRRYALVEEATLPQQCERTCSLNNNDFIDECLFDCLVLASVNVSQALHVSSMHVKVSRERRQSATNDKLVVSEFKECYRKGSVCKRMDDPDGRNNSGIMKQASILAIIYILGFYVIVRTSN